MLPDDFFSLGMDVDYYQKVFNFPKEIREELLVRLRDVVYASEIIETITNEKVFNRSLLRHVSLSVIKGQYVRVLQGGVPLTDLVDSNLLFQKNSNKHQ